MRILYKALASVGMVALSTAAALGVRHLTIASKKRKQAKENAASDNSAQNLISDAEDVQDEAELNLNSNDEATDCTPESDEAGCNNADATAPETDASSDNE